MKKMVVLATAFTLALSSSIAYAKGVKMGGSRSMSVLPSKSKATTQQQKDADFSNTAYKPIPNTASQAQAQSANAGRMNGLVTGMAAGYLLNEVLSSNEAQAQTTKPEQRETSASSVPEQMQVATPAIASFKAIEPQSDPYLIEKTAGYLRYCLNGVQYLVPTANSQLAPTLMVDRNNAPAQCVIVPKL